jgi:hypothetical protein
MKKQTTIFGFILIASLVITSCTDSNPTACECADLGVEAMTELFASFDDSTKMQELSDKWEVKLKPCEDLQSSSEEFKSEFEECLKTKMSEME